MGVLRFKDFIKINENDNLTRSTKGLDKFGMTDYKKLPIELENELKSNEFKYESDHGVLDTTEESVFIRKFDVDGIIYIVEIYLNTCNDEGDPDQNTSIGIAINIHSGGIYLNGGVERDDYKKIINFIEDFGTIKDELEKITQMNPDNRMEKLDNILERFGIEVYYTEPGDDFI